MKNLLALCAVFLVGVAGLGAQGRGRHPMGGMSGSMPASTPGSVHSNAPAGTPSASVDRDFGRSRAEDVGGGKKKGLQKNTSTSHKKSKKTGTQSVNR